MANKKIFITGGCGFIGVNLVKYLLDATGYDLTVYDNLSTGSIGNLRRATAGFGNTDRLRFVKGDIMDKRRLGEVTKRHQVIIHLAAHTDVTDSIKNPKEDFDINAMGTFNLLETARKNKIGKFIFASSNAVVGEQTPPINEEKIPSPLSPYGASKLAGEALCLAYGRSFGIDTIIVRFANCYGPYSDHKTSVIAKFIKNAKQEKALEIYGDGNQTRDFIHTDDICRAIHLFLTASPEKYNTSGNLFQIAYGRETKISELGRMIKDIFLKNGYRPPRIEFKAARKGEIMRNYTDISKVKRLLGFSPRVRLEDGLLNVVDFFMNSKANRTKNA